jgi:hypothetical protein
MGLYATKIDYNQPRVKVMKLKKLGSLIIVYIFASYLSTAVYGQSEYLYKHNWEAIPIRIDLFTGTHTNYKVDIMHFRFRILEVGAITRFYNQEDLFASDAKNPSYSKFGYIFPFGFNIPIRQKKDFQLSLNSKYYWSIKPNIIDLDIRADKEYFSAFAGYRFSSFDDNEGVYIGVSLGLHHFSNNRKLSEIQEKDINKALCNSTTNECVIVDISKKNYLEVHANLRRDIPYNSPFFFMENDCLNFNCIDSMCMNRSMEILNTLYDNNYLKDLAGIELHLYYGAFKVATTYDNGTESSTLTTQNYDDRYNPYHRESSVGFSSTTITNGPFNLYSIKVEKTDFKEDIKPIKSMNI